MAGKRRRSRRKDDRPYELVDEVARPRHRRRGSRRRPRRSWFLRLVFLTLFLAALAAAAPAIVARTPLRNAALSQLGDRLGVQLEAQQMSSGWLSKTVAEEVVIRDLDGQPLLTAATLELDRSLLSLLRSRANLGTLRLNRPVAHVSLRPEGSNWQQAFAPLFSGPSSGPVPKLNVEVTDGQIHLQDDRRMWSRELGPLQLTGTLDPRSETPLRAEVVTLLDASGGAAGGGLRPVSADGPAAARVEVGLIAHDLALSGGQSHIRTQQLPLSLVESLIAPVAPGWQLQGQLDVDATTTWSGEEQLRGQVQIASLSATQLVAVTPHLAPGDAIRLQQVTGRGELQLEDGLLRAHGVQLNSSAAKLTADGQLQTRRPDNAAALADADAMDLSADVDLAQLAAMLPRTLRIRNDTRIESGQVAAGLTSRLEQGQRVWHATLNTSPLAATTAGRRVQWEQPVSIELDALQQNGSWAVRKLECNSSFLQMRGAGQAASGRVDVVTDLNRLRTELTQFVDLGQTRLAGTAEGYVNWQQGARGLESSGRIDLNQFQVVLPNKPPLTEPRLTLTFAAQGRTADGELTHVDSGQMTIKADNDQLVAELLESVPRNSQRPYPLKLRVAGDLGRWLMRAAVLSGNPHLQGEGTIDFNGSIAVSSQQLAISSSQLKAAPCRVVGLGIPIDEPELQASVIGSYDYATRRWIGGQSTLVSTTASARCDNLLCEPAPGGVSLSGDIAYRGDLHRLLTMFSATSPDRQYRGEIDGRARLTQQQGTTQFTIQQRLKEFKVLQRTDAQLLQTVANTSPWRQSWSEPFLDIAATGVYLPQQSVLQLESLEATGDSVRLNLAGQLADLGGRLNSDLNGQLYYDLKRLTTKLKPVTGDSVVLTGVSQKPISIRGPLRPPADAAQAVDAGPRPLLPLDLVAQAGFSWDSAVIEGFRIGPGEIRTSLENGTVRFDTMHIPVSDGRVMLSPQIDFRQATPILTTPPGPVIDHLTISPEMCRTWLKYVAPMLADSTRIQGAFSADLRQVAVPLTNPASGQLQGSLTIHGAQAGPGPLAQQLLGVVKQVETAVKAVEQGGGANLDRALQLLNNGGLVDANGRIDPQRAIGNLLGGAPAPTAGAAGSTTAQWLKVPEHQIGFHVAAGRVHHENMRMLIDNIEVLTTGSVGLDESLALTAELPIPDKWIGSTPALAGLRGQKLKLPISGTVRRPQIDSSVVSQLTRQLLTGALSGAAGRLSTPGTPGLNPNPNAPANPADPINGAINNAADNLGQEVDRALRGLFNK